MFGSYQLWDRLTLRAGVNNILNKRPPYVENRYSGFGDPRLASFHLNLPADF